MQCALPDIRNRLLLPLLALLAACQTLPAAAPLSTAQVTALQANGFQKAGENWELGLDSKLLFPSDGTTLESQQVVQLDHLASALSGVGIHGLRIEGHTDSVGTKAYNMQLSLRRATAVRAVMIAKGNMAEGNVHAIGRGEDQPVETNLAASGRRENRRVVIIVSPADAGAQ